MASDIDHQKEMQAHAGTYDGFIRWLFRGTVVAFLLAALVIFLISH